VTALQWVAIGFAAFLIGVLVVAFFFKDQITPAQSGILRLFCALCAGFAGGLLTGDALFRLDSQIAAGTKLAISGTAGFALFFTVWFTCADPRKTDSAAPPNGSVSFTVPDSGGWDFKGVVEGLAKGQGVVVQFEGFSPGELATPIRNKQIVANSIQGALRSVRWIAGASAIRPYKVVAEPPLYRLIV
jgi:hypothetical protein